MFATSSTAAWLIGCVVALGGGALFLALTAILVWALGDSRRRRLEKSRGRWERLVVEYLCQSIESQRLRVILDIADTVKGRQRVAFGEFVLAYLEEIRGAEAERLRQLLDALRYEQMALRALRSSSAWSRALAAESLGALRSRTAVAALVRATDDRSELVSYSAAAALVRIGGREGLAAVAGALGRRSDWNAAQIKELLLEVGSEFGADLLALLEHSDPGEPKAKVLVELIGMIRYLEAGPHLLELLRSGPPMELRVSLIRSLGRIEFTDALPETLEALRDPEWVVRSQAALALSRIGNHGALFELANALSDASYWVRYNAAIALGSLGAAGRAILEQVAGGEDETALLAREVLLEAGAA